MDWRDQAACRSEQPDLFFPVGTTGPAWRQLAKAKSICHRCPVMADCLAWAVHTSERYGVWGGLSEDERDTLRRRRAQISARGNLILISAAEEAAIDELQGLATPPRTGASREPVR
jgi:WhiB family redox-sensing transcriptional regulator